MRTAFIVVLMWLASSGAMAQTGLYLPAAVPSPGQDEFRASDGTSCRTTMDGSKRVEVGTFATGGQQAGNNYSLPGYASNPAQSNVGVYGRYTWTLDAKTDRMDCNKLFQLEIEKKQIEIEMMKQSLKAAETQLDAVKANRPRRATEIELGAVRPARAQTVAEAQPNADKGTRPLKNADPQAHAGKMALFAGGSTNPQSMPPSLRRSRDVGTILDSVIDVPTALAFASPRLIRAD